MGADQLRVLQAVFTRYCLFKKQIWSAFALLFSFQVVIHTYIIRSELYSLIRTKRTDHGPWSEPNSKNLDPTRRGGLEQTGSVCVTHESIFLSGLDLTAGSYDRQPGKKENQYWLNFTKTNWGGKQAGEAHKNDSVVFRKGERERIWQGRRKMPRTITLTLKWEYKEPAADKQAAKHTVFNTLKSDARQSRNQSMWRHTTRALDDIMICHENSAGPFP